MGFSPPGGQSSSGHISPHSEITIAMRGLLLAPHCTCKAAATTTTQHSSFNEF